MTTAFTWPFCTSLVGKDCSFSWEPCQVLYLIKEKWLEVYSNLYRFWERKTILRTFFHHLTVFSTLRSITRGQGFPLCLKWSPGGEQDPDFWGRPQGQSSCIFITNQQLWTVSTSWKSTLKQPFPNICQRKSQFNLRLETEMRISLDRQNINKPSTWTGVLFLGHRGIFQFSCLCISCLLYVTRYYINIHKGK